MIRERGFSRQITYSKRLGWGLMGRRRGCSSVAEQLPRMLEALGLIPTTKEKKTNTNTKTNNYTKKGKAIKILKCWLGVVAQAFSPHTWEAEE